MHAVAMQTLALVATKWRGTAGPPPGTTIGPNKANTRKCSSLMLGPL